MRLFQRWQQVNLRDCNERVVGIMDIESLEHVVQGIEERMMEGHSRSPVAYPVMDKKGDVHEIADRTRNYQTP